MLLSLHDWLITQKSSAEVIVKDMPASIEHKDSRHDPIYADMKIPVANVIEIPAIPLSTFIGRISYIFLLK